MSSVYSRVMIEKDLECVCVLSLIPFLTSATWPRYHNRNEGFRSNNVVVEFCGITQLILASVKKTIKSVFQDKTFSNYSVYQK